MNIQMNQPHGIGICDIYHVAKIFETLGQKMFTTLVIYSYHTCKCFVYVAKYSHLHGWSTLIKETISFNFV